MTKSDEELRVDRWHTPFNAILPAVYAAFPVDALYGDIVEHAAGLATIQHGPLYSDELPQGHRKPKPSHPANQTNRP
jgi:hypothetical protein